MASAVIASNAATQAATAARKAECQTVIKGYVHEAANVAGQKHYAECVQLMNPDPMSGAEVIAFKVCAGIVLLSMLIGAGYLMVKEGGIESLVLGLVVGAACGFLLSSVVLLAVFIAS